MIDGLIRKGYRIISLELTTESLPINEVKFNLDMPIALIVGDERFGISDELLSKSHRVVHIEMFGHNSSMNVAQATNIALFEITRQQL